MCNLSLPNNNSTSYLDDPLKWYMYCVCQGHVGTFAIIVLIVVFLIVGTPVHCWSLQLLLSGNIQPKLVIFGSRSVGLMNLTIVELVCCIQCVADLIATCYPSVATYKSAMFLIGLSWTVRPLPQICMCFDHYLAVIHPVTFLRYKSIQYRIAPAAAAWLIGIGNSLRLILTEMNFFPDHTFFLVFGIAVIIISLCCASVLHALKRPGPGVRKNVEMTEKNRHNKSDKGRSAENQQKMKAFRIISHTLMSILICYLPQVASYITLLAETNMEMYVCNIFPLSLCFTSTMILITPVVRMYNEGYLKHIPCLSKFREQRQIRP